VRGTAKPGIIFSTANSEKINSVLAAPLENKDASEMCMFPAQKNPPEPARTFFHHLIRYSRLWMLPIIYSLSCAILAGFESDGKIVTNTAKAMIGMENTRGILFIP
jgi:hypothetical protein